MNYKEWDVANGFNKREVAGGFGEDSWSGLVWSCEE